MNAQTTKKGLHIWKWGYTDSFIFQRPFGVFFTEIIGFSFLKIFLIAQNGSGPDGKGLWRCLRQVPPRSQCCLRCHFLGEKSTNIEDNWEILRTNREILTNNLMMPVIHRLETRASQRRSCSECEPFWEFAAASFKRCSMASPLSLVRHRWDQQQRTERTERTWSWCLKILFHALKNFYMRLKNLCRRLKTFAGACCRAPCSPRPHPSLPLRPWKEELQFLASSWDWITQVTANRSSREKTTFLLQTQVCSGVPLHAKNSAVKHARSDLLSLAGLLHHQGQGGHQSFLDKKMVNQLQVEDKKKWGSDYSFPSEGSAKAKQPGGFQENRKPYENPLQENPPQTPSCQSWVSAPTLRRFPPQNCNIFHMIVNPM